MKSLFKFAAVIALTVLPFAITSCSSDDAIDDMTTTASNVKATTTSQSNYPLFDDFHSDCKLIKTFGADSKCFVEAYLQETTRKGVNVCWKAIYYLDAETMDECSPIYFTMESSGENVYLKSFRIHTDGSYLHVGTQVSDDFIRTYRYLNVNTSRELFHVTDGEGITDGYGIPYNAEISVNDSVSSMGLCFNKFEPGVNFGDDGLIRLVDKKNDGNHTHTYTFIDSNIIRR